MKTIAHQENSVLGIYQLQDPVGEKTMMIGAVESHPTGNLPGLITTKKLHYQHQPIKRIHGIIRNPGMVKITAANLQGIPIMIK